MVDLVEQVGEENVVAELEEMIDSLFKRSCLLYFVIVVQNRCQWGSYWGHFDWNCWCLSCSQYERCVVWL